MGILRGIGWWRKKGENDINMVFKYETLKKIFKLKFKKVIQKLRSQRESQS